jgi:hypothetical protein
MSIVNKLKWIFGILLIFLLVLATNLIDRNNFLRIKDSTVNIYENRLIAKSIIYDLSLQVHRKEIALITADSNFFHNEQAAANILIAELLDQFSRTRLSRKEKTLLNTLNLNIEQLSSPDKKLSYQEKSLIKKQRALIKTIRENLDSLALIQLEEGKRQVMLSDKTISSIKLFTQIEIYFLIALAIMVQFLIMYKPKS